MRTLIAAFGWVFGSLAAAAVYSGIVVLAKSFEVASRGPDAPDGVFDALRPRTEEQRILYRRGAWILGGWALSVSLATVAWFYLKHTR